LGDRVSSAGGLEVSIIPDHARYAAMTGAQQAWTIPGTNTLELALAGLPSLVLLPLHRAELLPLEGVAHWLSLIPVLGPWAKRRVIAYLEPRAGLLALPNQRLGQMVFPELRGTFTPQEVAQKAQELLAPERSAAVRELLTGLPREPGAQRLAEVILS
jgi:lipid-A-disaccharide synthase